MYFCVKSGIFFFHFSSSLAWKTNIPEGFLLSEVSGIHWLPPKALNQTKVSLLDLMFHLYCYDYVGVCSKFRAWVWEEEGSYLESKVWAMWDALLIPWICQNETHSVRKKWDAVNTLLFHQFSLSVVSNLLWPHGLQHAMLPCPSITPGATQIHVHHLGDAIQLAHPLLSPSPPTFNLSQHQGLFHWVGSSISW